MSLIKKLHKIPTTFRSHDDNDCFRCYDAKAGISTSIVAESASIAADSFIVALLQKALQPSAKNIGSLDPSLQHDFSKLCLFHDAYTFHDPIERCKSQFGKADILELLSKCLRGKALT